MIHVILVLCASIVQLPGASYCIDYLFISLIYITVTLNVLLLLCSCYRTVPRLPSTIWKIFSEFFIFCNFL